MPLPLALAALAAASAAAAGFGGVQAHSAYKDKKETTKKNDKAQQVYKSAVGQLKKSRSNAQSTMERLGKLKLEIWSEELGRFVELFNALKNVDLTGEAFVDALGGAVQAPTLLNEVREHSFTASRLVVGGVASVGSGVLTGFAAYGGAMSFATASTGTAITSLSGAAATNATLAWFGGGSLAAGGAGMAGGMAVLGGIVAGPVLAVGGTVLSAHARKGLAEAEKNLAQARVAAAEMRTAAKMVDGIRRVCESVNNILESLRAVLHGELEFLARLQTDVGVDWNDYSLEQKTRVMGLVNLAGVTKSLLEVSILTENGAIDPQHARPLRDAKEALKPS